MKNYQVLRDDSIQEKISTLKYRTKQKEDQQKQKDKRKKKNNKKEKETKHVILIRRSQLKC